MKVIQAKWTERKNFSWNHFIFDIIVQLNVHVQDGAVNKKTLKKKVSTNWKKKPFWWDYGFFQESMYAI